jgi:hypothetical protein
MWCHLYFNTETHNCRAMRENILSFQKKIKLAGSRYFIYVLPPQGLPPYHVQACVPK